MPVVLVADPQAARYRDGLLAAAPEINLRLATDRAAVTQAAPQADAIIAFGSALDDAVIAGAARLRWLQFLSSGTDALLRWPSLKPGVIFTSTHGVHGPPVAEMAFMHMLALARDLPAFVRDQAAQRWIKRDQPLLHGKTLVIAGTGLIASALAQRAAAFGMKVIGLSRTPRALEHFTAVHPLAEIAGIAAQADFLVLLAPLSDATRNLVDAPVLAAMKPGAYLVNVGRGGLVDEDALIAALRERRIAGAGLDTAMVEPLPPDHPFWHLPNVIVTPHVAGHSDCYADLVMPVLAHNLRAFVAGREAEMRNRH